MCTTLSSLDKKQNGWDVFCVFFCSRSAKSENIESGLNYIFYMIHISIWSYLSNVILYRQHGIIILNGIFSFISIQNIKIRLNFYYDRYISIHVFIIFDNKNTSNVRSKIRLKKYTSANADIVIPRNLVIFCETL